MSRRVAPLLKDVEPAWTHGPMTRSKRYRARLAAAQADTRPPFVRRDPVLPGTTGLQPLDAKPLQASARPALTKNLLPIPEPGTRRHVAWVAQHGRCYYCTHVTPLEQWTLDHKIARAKGGRNHAGNRVGACWTCNKAKRTLSAEEFLATEYIRRRRLEAR